MGRRNEQRITVSFGVVARGVDPRGNSFEISTQTHDISCTGACLLGLSSFVEPGSKIEIQHKDQKAHYRVQWVSEPGAGFGRAGLRCLEPGAYIWGVPPKEWEPDTYDPSNPAPAIYKRPEAPPEYGSYAGWSGSERRQFPRHSCRIEAQVGIGDGSVDMPGTVTDISMGGCYVEMFAPLPPDTIVKLDLKTGESPLQMSGKVRSSQTGMGMGISFTQIKPADFEVLRRLAPPAPTSLTAVTYSGAEVTDPSLAQPPKPKPAPTPIPSPRPAAPADVADLPATAEAFQALTRLLLRKGLLTRAELLDEMKQRKAK